MARYDVVVIGAGLGGLTAGAILAREGRKVLVIERSNSVGGAASSYKSGELFVEGSLHETSDPHDPRDPKHDVLTRAGVIDAVKWIPAGAFYEARGGPLDRPFVMPDNFDAARRALGERFPEARAGIDQLLGEMEAHRRGHGHAVARRGASSDPRERSAHCSSGFPQSATTGGCRCRKSSTVSSATTKPSNARWRPISPIITTTPRSCGGSFLRWRRASYLQSGGRFIQGGSQRLSSALARAVRMAGGEVLVRRVVSGIALDAQGRAGTITHTARDGSDPRIVEGVRIVSNAAPAAIAAVAAASAAERLTRSYAQRAPSISLFALTLGLSKPPREFGLSAYSTQICRAT